MKHFSLEQWTDFARNVVTEEARKAMEQHLDSGCKQCASVVAVWRSVHAIASQERGYEPPETAVRMAKGLGAIHVRADRPSLARLLFDSAQTPAVAGLRATSTSTMPRQLLYGVGPYRIDVRMEPQMDSDKISLVGQILNSADPARHATFVPVVLLRGRKKLAESLSNGLGEFHLECDLQTPLQLQVTLPHGAAVRISLVEPTIGQTVQISETIDSERDNRRLKRKSESTSKGV